MKTRAAALPVADAQSFGAAARRMTLIRAAVAALLVALIGTAIASASGLHPRASASSSAHPSTVVVLDLSASVSSTGYAHAARALEAVAREAGSEGRVGLVLFSDAAEDALPPGTPVAELEPFVRVLDARTPSSSSPTNPWSPSFSAGTAISRGLARARRDLEREGAGGRIVLVSDLGDSPVDWPRVRRELIALARNPAIRLEVVALPGAELSEKRFFRPFGVRQAPPARAAASAPRARSGEDAAFPWALVAVAVVVAFALGAYELRSVSLRWRPRQEAEA